MFSVIQGFFPKGLPHFGPVQRFATGNAVALPQHVHVPSHGGQPLPPAVRQKMEAVFGTSFATVRVHVGPHASALGALAFTRGSDIHFAPGHYNPVTPQGQQVLAHELAHVVQQRSGRVRNPFGGGTAIVEDASLEREAERMRVLASMNRLPVQAKRVVQRMEEVLYDDLDEDTGGLEQVISEEKWNSTSVYRVMPESEWTKMEIDKLPHSGTHFWSPDLTYVQDYFNKPNTGSTSTHFVQIPLGCTFKEFLAVAAGKGKLHTHHYRSYWSAAFGTAKKGKKNGSVMSVKAELGTPNITFNLEGMNLPVWLRQHMGAPVLLGEKKK